MPSVVRGPAIVVAAALLVSCGDSGDSPVTQPDAEQPSASASTSSEPSATNQSTAITTPPEAAPPPVPAELAFTAETVDGATFDGQSLAGKDAVVYFWAPWCPVCRREAPGLAAVVAGYPDLTFVTVGGSSQDRDAMAGFVSDVGFDDFTNVADESGEVWTRFGVTYQYTYAFVDDLGTVELVTGPLDEADVRARLDALLAS